ncbi:uncharacterized protein [Montipora capricornis]
MKKPQVDQCSDPCYLKYFAGGSVPTGLNLSNSVAMSCICQTDKSGNDYFATYFYDDAGIAAYSAYTIQASDAKDIGKYKRPQVKWEDNKGITKEGTDALYKGSSAYKIDRGHLNPNYINSYDKNHQIATFKYTNAVPQYQSSNRRSWRVFEAKIAKYVKTNCKQVGSNMYLITGTSNYLFDSSTNGRTGAMIELFPPGNPNGIVRPNSLWTAGCCVVSKTTAWSIAVWGNNVKVDAETISLSLKDLEKLLGTSPGPPANLFPGIPLCRNDSRQL